MEQFPPIFLTDVFKGIIGEPLLIYTYITISWQTSRMYARLCATYCGDKQRTDIPNLNHYLLCKQEDIQLMTILQKRLSMDTVYYADHTYCYTFTSTDDPQWQ